MEFTIPAQTTFWLRFVLFLYKFKWRIKSFLRFFGFKPKMSWDELSHATTSLLPGIAQYNPEIIIGIGVGGAIWGAVIAGNLHDKPFLTIDRKIIQKNNERFVKLVGVNSIKENRSLIKGKRVLLVTAELYSGQTAHKTRRIISKLQPAEIKLATLDCNSVSNPSPDFCYLKDGGIIQKPWRLIESYTNPDYPVRM